MTYGQLFPPGISGYYQNKNKLSVDMSKHRFLLEVCSLQLYVNRFQNNTMTVFYYLKSLTLLRWPLFILHIPAIHFMFMLSCFLTSIHFTFIYRTFMSEYNQCIINSLFTSSTTVHTVRHSCWFRGTCDEVYYISFVSVQYSRNYLKLHR